MTDAPVPAETLSTHPLGSAAPGSDETVASGAETVASGAETGPGDTEPDSGADQVAEPARSGRLARLEREGDIAADYLEELLDIADLDGDIDMDVEGERAVVSIVGGDLTRLVGRDGVVLDALQELTRLAVLRETGERSRLMLDVAGYRAQRREQLTALGREAAERVGASGQPVALEPMNAFERKVVHDAIAAAGLVSESEGEEPHRYVVVRPA